MRRRFVVAVFAAACLAAWPATALGHAVKQFGPGAPGIGDPYFPLDGNGGYDARHYDLDVAYDPPSDVLGGVATIRARATQNLSRFNLDLVGLTVRSIRVGGRRATWTRDAGELTVTPKHGIRKGKRFRTVVVYDGVPETVDAEIGVSGFVHTDDGTFVAGQPDVAATWYPVNDHPLDKASYTFHITVPAGLVAMSNGELEGKRTRRGRTTWNWDAEEPMASYLTTATIGEFDLSAYRKDGIRYWDAIDPDLFAGPVPRTGARYAISQRADLSYKRLARTISVPAGGAQLSFWVDRDTEEDWDFMFVEAHPAGTDGWTTLPDLNGHTSDATGNSCPFGGWQEIHPFLAHYQTDNGDGTCTPTGTTGTWNAATGAGDGPEQWTVDLSPYAGHDVEVSISYASDEVVQRNGVFVDDVTVTGGAAGSTSFEDDGDTLDGWTVPGAPEGSPGNTNDWIAGTPDDAPPTRGKVARAALDKQPEIIAFEEGLYGRYPFSASGGIVDDEGLGFALETQTRPVYAPEFFGDQLDADAVVVHELAHQWVGDHVALAAWQHIWLNEGFATYTEWLWSEHKGGATAQETFDNLAAGIPADEPFWQVVIGDPGPDHVLDIAVYFRGAMTLHALRSRIGDDDFFRLLRRWVRRTAGGNATIPEFIALAERLSGQDLGDFFETWLFTAGKPAGIEPQARALRRADSRAAATARARALLRKAMKR